MLSTDIMSIIPSAIHKKKTLLIGAGKGGERVIEHEKGSGNLVVTVKSGQTEFRMTTQMSVFLDKGANRQNVWERGIR